MNCVTVQKEELRSEQLLPQFDQGGCIPSGLAKDIKTVPQLTGRYFKKQVCGHTVPAISVTESKAANCVDCRCSQNGLPESTLSIRIAVEGDVIDFEPILIVCARQAGLTISETADLLAILQPAISRFYCEWPEKEAHFPVSSSSLGQSDFLM